MQYIFQIFISLYQIGSKWQIIKIHKEEYGPSKKTTPSKAYMKSQKQINGAQQLKNQRKSMGLLVELVSNADRGLFFVKLDPTVNRDQWTFQQQKRLYQLHDEIGNKWAIISNKLGPGRTDNNVKNHFFSKLRKSLRKINKIIKEQYKKQFKIIQNKVIYKIIEASQQKFKQQPMFQKQIIEYSKLLKNKIIMFCYDDTEIVPLEIIREIVQFNKNYKRKPKKLRNVGGPYPQLAQKIDYNEQCQEDEQDDMIRQNQQNSMVFETHQQKIINPIILTSARDKSLRATALSANDDELLSSHNHQQNMKNGNNQQVLQALGLLEDQMDNPHAIFMKKQRSVSYASSQYHQQSQQFKFFEDSSVQNRFPNMNLSFNIKKQSQEERLFN